MNDKDINLRLATALGWKPNDSPAPSCPECGMNSDRQKCAWDYGGGCPRHEVYQEWEDSKNPISYTDSLDAMTDVETVLRQNKIIVKYVEEIVSIISSKSNVDKKVALWGAVLASAKTRAQAALNVLEHNQENK